MGGDDEAEDDSAEEDEEEEEEEEEEEDKEEEDEYGDEEVDEQSQSPTAEYTEEEYADMCNLPMASSTVQQTLNNSVLLEGIAIHSNKIACIKVMPAFAGEGRYFVLVPPGSLQYVAPVKEVPEVEEVVEVEPPKITKKRSNFNNMDTQKPKEPPKPTPRGPDKIKARRADERVVMAVLDNAIVFPEDSLFTTLEQDGVRIFAAETLLASLEACGIDNARIEVEARVHGEGPAVIPPELRLEDLSDEDYAPYRDESKPQMDFKVGQELPFGEGSALYWTQAFKDHGVRKAPIQNGAASKPKQHLVPRKIVSVREGESFITLMPCDSQRISVGINYQEVAPVVGAQWASWSPADTAFDHFRWSIAAARPFHPSGEEAFRRRAEGYYKGMLNAGLVAVADYGTWHMLEQLRFPDEAVRRRLMEFIADMSLLSQEGKGAIPKGHIVAYQASKDLTLKFMRAVRRLSEEQ